jgi:hypothetical protein
MKIEREGGGESDGFVKESSMAFARLAGTLTCRRVFISQKKKLRFESTRNSTVPADW